jgi:hypothetical protein
MMIMSAPNGRDDEPEHKWARALTNSAQQTHKARRSKQSGANK